MWNWKKAFLRVSTAAVWGALAAQIGVASDNADSSVRTGPIFVDAGKGRPFALSSVDIALAIVESGTADFSVFEHEVAPDPQGVPLHQHNSYDEGFFVLDGEVDFVVGEQSRRCGRGSFAFVPRGFAHTFSNPGPKPARLLVIGSSGVQALVEEVAPLVNDTPVDLEAVFDAFARHDSVLLISPPPESVDEPDPRE